MSAGQHDHCDKCYNLHCQVPVQTSFSCTVITCYRNCGATFHMCKHDEHRLLCPNETVPCLNVDYGCPLTMLHHKLAKHLEMCPASIVCCSQEWNRWPVPDTDMTFYANISESLQSNTETGLDVALALRDQALLFQSIKMRKVFPELTEEEPVLQNHSIGTNGAAEEGASCRDCCGFAENVCVKTEGKELSQEERSALAKSSDVASFQSYSQWEKIFQKEKEGCNLTVKNLKKDGKGKGMEERNINSEGRQRNPHRGEENAVAARIMNGATGLAPWQDGVLERLGKEVNIAEYNMYLVHNGAMLINFGQLAACTPREKDFVYGNLEPIEVKTVRSFNVPTSYRAKRSHLKDPSHKAKTKHQNVGTDLGTLAEELPKSEEVGSTLLCSMEKELKGHLISESSSTDGLYVDIGTQTYIFSSAPFKADASLADVIAGKPRGLYVCTEAESVTRRHNKISSAFSFMCGHFFRRAEYHSHFRNVHCDIQASVNGWFQQRCPLAYLGCTFTQIRFHPEGQQATIKFCQDVSAFKLLPHFPTSLCDGVKSFIPQGSANDCDALSRLPMEILQHIAGYLDSLTLSQLSQVSCLMREVCATLLQERGMVFLEWKKKTYKHGGSLWKCQKKVPVWKFSSLFSPVNRWSFSNAPSMSDHLRTCMFYQKEERMEPVALACLGEVRNKCGGLEHK